MNIDEPSGANFSRCRTYRYTLWRVWDRHRAPVMMIGLNPSTADARTNDPTIRRCIGFAHEWGAGGLIMTNLFAYRATHPQDLKQARDPVGPRNRHWLRAMARLCPTVVAAWGNDGRWLEQSSQVQALLDHQLKVIRLNKSGEPAHPLYLPKRLRPIPWPAIIATP